LQFPAVQNRIADRATRYLSERIQTPVGIDHIEIDFFNRLRLEGVYIEDLSGDTLLYAQALEAQLSLFAPLQQTLHVQDFRLENTVAKLHRGPDSLFNYQFIIDAFASDTPDTTSSSPAWTFGLRQLELEDVRFQFVDSILQTQVYTHIGQFEGLLNELDINNQRIDIEQLDFKNSYAEVATRSESDAPLANDTTSTSTLSFPYTGWQLSASTLNLVDLAFSYNDFSQAPAPNGQFDPSHLNFEAIALEAQDFQWDSSQLQLQLDRLAFRELNGFELQQMGGQLLMDEQQIKLQALSLQTNHSRLAPSEATLNYTQFDDLSRFVEAVEMEVQLHQADLQLDDIQYWTGPIPYLRNDSGTRFQLDGQIDGRVNQLNIGQLQLQANQTTRLSAKGRINGLPDIDQLFVDVQLQEASSSYTALSRLLRDVELPEGLQTFGRFRLQANLNGQIDSLRATPIRLRTASATSFDGRLWASGLPEVDDLRFQLDIDSFLTDADDIKAFATQPLPVQLDTLGSIRYSGQINGTAYEFSVNGQLYTQAGSSTQDLRIAFNKDYSDAQYNGQLGLEELALGALLANPSLGTLSMQMQAQGEGLTPDSVNTRLDGRIYAVTFNEYTYKDIELHGQLDGLQYDGQLRIDDPNLKFQFDGLANLKDSIPEFRFTAQLDTADLQALNFYPSPLRLKTRAEVQLSGNQLDNLEGQAKLRQFYIGNDTAQYEEELIQLNASKQGNNIRLLRFDSKLAKVQIQGQYELAKFTGATLDFVDTFFPIKRLLEGDSTATDSLFLEPAFAKQNFTFQLQLDEPTRLTKVVLPALEKLDTAWLKGSFRGTAREVEVDGLIPVLAYNGIELDSIKLDVKGDPQQLMAQVSAKSPRSGGQTFAKQVQSDLHFFRDSLKLELSALSDSNRRKLVINTLLSPANDQRLQLQFLPPFYLNRQLWNIPADHRIVFGQDYLYADGVRLSKDEQALYAQSQPNSSGAFPPLSIGFERFKIQELTKLANLDADYLSGLLQGEIQLTQPDTSLRYALNLSLDDLMVDKEPIGRLQIDAQPNTAGNLLNLNAQLSGAQNDLRVAGQYGLEEGSLDFELNSKGLQLAPVDFFALGNTRDSRGRINADLSISGTAQAPKVLGRIGLDSASTFVEYLQTRFTVPQHELQLKTDELVIGQMPLLDNSGRRASLSGRVQHNQFQDIRLDLNFDAPSFLVLDTKAGDNDLFYGKILVRANASIRGPLELPNIDLTTTTLPGTQLTALPLSEEQAIVQDNFIIYGTPEEYRQDTSANNSTRVYQTSTTGYDLSLRLNLTPDAQITAIIDPSTGDKLTARGNANLLVEMDPNGQLRTTGTIILTSGRYALNYEGVVKRNFDIREGSTVYLPGDPLDARFDITATYSTQAPVYALIQNEAQSLDPSQEQAARRRQDVRVLMRMEGTLSAPEISFELERGSSVSGNIADIVDEKFARLQEDENELNKQVFGLLLFNGFLTSSGGGDLATTGENIALSSVSSLLSNQLNRLANQYVEGVDINVGVDSYVTDQSNTAVTEVELGLSKQLFNDRLSVEVGGNLGVSESGEQSNTAIAGNFLLEYKLTEDGRYRVRVFRRPDYDVFTDGIRTGASLLYKKSFGKITPDSIQVTEKNND
jgi:hypothetical protein